MFEATTDSRIGDYRIHRVTQALRKLRAILGDDGVFTDIDTPRHRIAPILPPAKFTLDSAAALLELVYELLDAHNDTARLAEELTGDERWAAHLDYLRDLQRTGRETLAWQAR
jgi:hypothetical protein